MPEQAHTLHLELNREQYLLFGVGEGVYAVPVASVTEIVLLPELMPIAERAPYVIGVVDLRGSIVPVVDLPGRLGRPGNAYSIDDYLLVLEHAGQEVALVVNETMGVHPAPAKTSELATEPASACVKTVVAIDNTIVMLLDLDQVLKSVGQHVAASPDPADQRSISQDSIAIACEADRDELRRRAEQLRQSVADTDADRLVPFAVAEINGEFFGFDLHCVREFCKAQQIARVPCCPEHIVGNVNVRGDVLTVIDIRRELNLPRGDWTPGNKIIVAGTKDVTVGLLVDELHGVVYRLVSETEDDPRGSPATKQPIVKGTVPFRDAMMCLLNLPVLLELDRWVVDEEVPHV